MCKVVQPVVEGGDTTLTCSMTYDWQARNSNFSAKPKLDVTLSWTGVSGTTVKTTADPKKFSETVETSMMLKNASSGYIPSHTCTIEFAFSKIDKLPQEHATNRLYSSCVANTRNDACRLSCVTNAMNESRKYIQQ